jgi:hypothetical protein
MSKNTLETLVNEFEDFKTEISNLKDRYVNAGDYIKDHCNSVRNSLQMQIEIQLEKLRTIHDHFLNEIDVYETNCVRQFDSNDHFRNKIDGFLKEADDITNKIDNSELNDVENELVESKDRSKIMLEELKNEQFQGLPIEFKSRNFVPTLGIVGYMIYRKSNVILKGLNEMNSVDLTRLDCYDIRNHYNCMRLTSDEFLAAYVDSDKRFGCVKFDSTGVQLKSLRHLGGLNVIQILKVCQSDSFLYFYGSLKKKQSMYTCRCFLTQYTTGLLFLKQFDITDPLSCITATSTGVYCLKKDTQSISIYEPGFEFQNKLKSIVSFEWIDTALPNKPVFHQMEVLHSKIFLLTSGRLLVLNENTCAVLKVLNMSVSVFKCLEDDFLLCITTSKNKMSTFKVYDIKNEMVCQEKVFSEAICPITDDTTKSISCYVKLESKIYF